MPTYNVRQAESTIRGKQKSKRLQRSQKIKPSTFRTSCPVAAASAEIRLVLPTPGLPSRSTAFLTYAKQQKKKQQCNRVNQLATR